MAFQKLTVSARGGGRGTGEPMLTMSKGSASANSALGNEMFGHYRDGDEHFVGIYFDAETNRIGLVPRTERAIGDAKVTRNGAGGVWSMRGALKDAGFDADSVSGAFALTHDGTYWVLDLDGVQVPVAVETEIEADEDLEEFDEE